MLKLAFALGLTCASSQELIQTPPEQECDGRNGSITQGALRIGGLDSAYVAGAIGSVDGDRLVMKHNGGASVLSTCENHWKPESIMQFKLLGRTMKFTVDLSQAGCACNVAVYLIGAPALDYSGLFARGSDRGGQPPYYCDANKVGGQWCPEIDIMEANNRVFQSTLHRCDAPVNGHYSNCDRSGCEENTREIEASYGPGDDYTIDTRRPFDVTTQFLENAGIFTGMRTVLEQKGRFTLLNHSNCGDKDLSMLSEALQHGMSLRITYWGSDAETMAWMDAPPCGSQSSCSGENAGDATISNISVSEKMWEGFAAPRVAETHATEPPWQWHPWSSTTTTEPSETSPLVWVVVDGEGGKFGQAVPETITGNPELFVSLHGRGVVEWDGESFGVRQIRHSDIPQLTGEHISDSMI